MAPYDEGLRVSQSFYLINAGKIDEAIEWLTWVLQRNPSSTWGRLNLAWAYYFAGRFDEALANLRGNEEMVPGEAAAVYVRLGRAQDARAAIAAWLKKGPHSIATESCWPKEPMKDGYLADLRKAGLPEK